MRHDFEAVGKPLLFLLSLRGEDRERIVRTNRKDKARPAASSRRAGLVQYGKSRAV